MSKAHPGHRHSGGLLGMIRLAIPLLLLVLLSLLCWPAKPGGDAPAAGGAQTVLAKAKALRGAFSRGNDVADEFSETDINSYLTATLTRAEKPVGLQLHLREVRVDLHPETVDVWMKNTLYSWPIVYSVPVRVSRRADGSHVFEPGTVRIGHLPLPGPLRTRALGQLERTFRRLSGELEFINVLPSVALGEGTVKVSTLPSTTQSQDKIP